MPEACGYHVLNGARFSISELDRSFLSLFADTWVLAAHVTIFFATFAWRFSAHGARLRRGLYALAGVIAALGAGFRFQGFAVPFRITEMDVSFYEVVNSEVILVIVKPGTAANDLLELDHGANGPH